jgi:hypothetical protein
MNGAEPPRQQGVFQASIAIQFQPRERSALLSCRVWFCFRESAFSEAIRCGRRVIAVSGSRESTLSEKGKPIEIRIVDLAHLNAEAILEPLRG